ncbi:conidial wall protein [Beauveria brongniartii RCEF 3172]|uniref:Conidial wall protein n=1 Tax=Beauveria brongniartii RCEF 3172 TaxID=1081107 RepID=A0A166XJZ2_9HYPO|nr:conidial wall protein [Beauveria brongniartii RCEF 3172]
MPFPGGQFIVRNRANHRVLDDSDMSTRPGTAVIDYDFNNHANQRWMFKNGRLYNVHSNLILTFKDLRPESLATQEEYHDNWEGQKFEYRDGIMSVVGHDDRVVGAWDRDVKIVRPDPHDNARRWDFH